MFGATENAMHLLLFCPEVVELCHRVMQTLVFKATQENTYVTLHGKTVNKVIARARHGPNTFARYLSNTLSVRICKKKQKK